MTTRYVTSEQYNEIARLLDESRKARELAKDDRLTCREKLELLAASRQLRDRAIGLGA